MRRWVFNICSALSLLLCIVLAVIWVRSYLIEDMWHCYASGWEYVKVGGGVIEYYRGPVSIGLPQKWEHAAWRYEGWRWRQSFWRQIGFGYDEDYVRIGPATLAEASRFWCSFLLPVLLTALMPAMWIFKHARQTRRLANCACPSCAYDLRATPGRCPECGYISTKVAAENISAT